MGETSLIVVNFLDGWRVRYDGEQSRAYKRKLDAIKIAVEIARSAPEHPGVVVQLDNGALQPIPVRWAPQPRRESRRDVA